MQYFSHLTAIVRALETSGEPSPLLQNLLISENMRDRFTREDIDNAAAILGFGVTGDLGVELENDVEDEFIENAWKEVVKKSWKDAEYGNDLQRKANDALRVIAEAKGRYNLRQIWQTKKNRMMSPDGAYKLLEVPGNVDDNMLITVFSIRVCEKFMIYLGCSFNDYRSKSGLLKLTLCGTPSVLLLNHGTASACASFSYLVRIVSSVSFPGYLSNINNHDAAGDVKAEVSLAFPRGLNQLGNTCYLNSLLQVGFSLLILLISWSRLTHMYSIFTQSKNFGNRS